MPVGRGDPPNKVNGLWTNARACGMVGSLTGQFCRFLDAMPKYQNTHKMRDGAIVLYRRSDQIKGLWHCRLRIRGISNYTILSTKTASLEEAMEFATETYDTYRNAIKNGLPLPKQRTWEALYKEFTTNVLAHKTNDRKVKFDRLWRKWLYPFWGKKPLENISPQQISAFWNWRISTEESEPATLIGLGKIFNQIVKYALFQGYLSKSAPIAPPIKPNKEAKRGAYTLLQLRAIPKLLQPYIASAKTDSDHHFARMCFYYFTMTSLFSGLRIGEALNLQWKDIAFKDDIFTIFVRNGKTGSRGVVPEVITKGYLAQWYIQTPFKKPDDYVFCNFDGTKRIQDSIGRLFRRSLGKEWKQDRFGHPLSPYSYRHTYICLLLQYGKATIHDIAANCGTSVAYVESNYSKIIPTDVAGRLRGNLMRK